jgi:hypothetical protein
VITGTDVQPQLDAPRPVRVDAPSPVAGPPPGNLWFRLASHRFLEFPFLRRNER